MINGWRYYSKRKHYKMVKFCFNNLCKLIFRMSKKVKLRKALKRNDKPVSLTILQFIGQLVNQVYYFLEAILFFPEPSLTT